MAVSGIGVRIGLEGANEFKDGLRGAAQEVKTYVAELKKAEGIKEPFAKSAESITALENAISNQKEVVRGFREQMELAMNTYGTSSTQVSKWREELTKAETKLNDLRSQLEKFSTTSVEIKGLGTFKRDMETMSQAISTFRSEYKYFENLSGFGNIFTKSSGMKSSLVSEIKMQEEVVKLLAEDYEKAAKESGKFSAEALELRGKLADANTELYNMRQELKDLPNALMLAGDEAKEFGSKVKGIGQGFSNIGRSTRGVSTAATGLLTGIVKESADFEKAMSQVAKVQGLQIKTNEKDAETFKKLEDRARELGRTTVFSAVEAAEALEVLGRAGLNAEQAIALSGPALDMAAAEEMEFAEATSILVDNLNALQLDKTEQNARALADTLAQTSRSSNTNISMLGDSMKYAASYGASLGWTMQDVAFALGLAADYGVKSTQAGTGMRQMLKSMVAPTGNASRLIDELGISLDKGNGEIKTATEFMADLRREFGDLDVEIFDTNGDLKDGEEIMNDFSMSIFYSSEKLAKLNALSQIFGTRALPTVLALINTGEDDFNELSVAIGNASGAAQEMAETALDNLSGEWTLFIDQVKDLALEFGQVLLPVLRDGLQTFREILAGFAGMDDGTKKMILKVIALTAAVSPFFSILGGITKGIGGIISVGGSLLTGIGKVVRFGSNLLGIGSSITTGINGAGGIISSVGAVGSAIGGGSTGLIGKLGSLVTAAGPFLLKGAVVAGVAAGAIWLGKTIIANWDSISEFLGNCWEGIKNFAANTWESIKSVAGKAWDGISSVVVGAAKGIYNGVTSVFSTIGSALSDVWGWIYNGASSLFSGIKGLASNLVSGLGNIFSGIGSTVSNIFSGIGNVVSSIGSGVGNLFSKGVSLGKDLVSGIGNGIVKGGSWVVNKAREFGSWVAGGIASFLHFSVPDEGPLSDADTWMPDMMNLFADGIRDNMGLIENAASGVGVELEDMKYNALDTVDSMSNDLNAAVGDLSSNMIAQFDFAQEQGTNRLNLLKQQATSAMFDMRTNATNEATLMANNVEAQAAAMRQEVDALYTALRNDTIEQFGMTRKQATKHIAELKAKAYVLTRDMKKQVAQEASAMQQNVSASADVMRSDVTYNTTEASNRATNDISIMSANIDTTMKSLVAKIKSYTEEIREALSGGISEGALQAGSAITEMTEKVLAASKRTAAIAALASAGRNYAYTPVSGGTTSTTTTNLGGITVNAAPGQSVEQIAQKVQDKIVKTFSRKKYAYS